MFHSPPPPSSTVEEFSLSEEDVEKCTATCPHPDYLESYLNDVRKERERERLHGFKAVETQPLVHVLSVSLTSEEDREGLVIHGTIHAEFQHCGEKIVHELFSSNEKMPQLVCFKGNLALNGPDYLCRPNNGCVPLLPSTRIVVNLSDTMGNEFAQGSFQLDDGLQSLDSGFHEVVRSILIPCKQSPRVLTLRYIVIPFAVGCRLDMHVFNRNSDDLSDGLSSSDFIGRIVAKYPSEECVLFDKLEAELDWRDSQLHLSRCWLALPAYSTLTLDVDLSKIGTSKKIVGSFTLIPEPCVSSDVILSTDYMITMNAAWFSPDYDYHEMKKMKVKEMMDTVGKDGASTSLPRARLWPSSAVEIFSIVIPHEGIAKQVYGSVEVISCLQRVCYPFKREESDALTVRPDPISIPLLDGSRSADYSLEMKVDIKDAENLLAVKGNLERGTRFFELGYNKLVCSLIRGQGGFAAVHYAIFPRAVEATIKIDLVTSLIVGGRAMGVGFVTVGYSCFDYSSSYSKDCYQIRLLDGDFLVEATPPLYYKIPLSRSKVIVPSHSGLVFRFQLIFYRHEYPAVVINREAVIEMGTTMTEVELSYKILLRIGVDWGEVM